LAQLNGIKHWIRGNHDYGLAKKPDVASFFQWIRDYYVLKVHDKLQSDEDEKEYQYHQPIVLSHFPILSWDGMSHGTWHLHGHCHGSIDKTWNATGTRMDVGVDTNNLYPYSYEDIKNHMALRTVTPVDHHV
jgi:calcineurin-like phosphoesterase family protein